MRSDCTVVACHRCFPRRVSPRARNIQTYNITRYTTTFKCYRPKNARNNKRELRTPRQRSDVFNGAARNDRARVRRLLFFRWPGWETHGGGGNRQHRENIGSVALKVFSTPAAHSCGSIRVTGFATGSRTTVLLRIY